MVYRLASLQVVKQHHIVCASEAFNCSRNRVVDAVHLDRIENLTEAICIVSLVAAMENYC